jgi:hypothetical protein
MTDPLSTLLGRQQSRHGGGPRFGTSSLNLTDDTEATVPTPGRRKKYITDVCEWHLSGDMRHEEH